MTFLHTGRNGGGVRAGNLTISLTASCSKSSPTEHKRRSAGTGKAPRFAIAYKFPPEQVQTILEDIVLQVTASGKLTPVAHLQYGRVVARPSPARPCTMRISLKKKTFASATVILQKAGDVIPEVVSVIKELLLKGAKVWKFPTHSSLCGGDGYRARTEKRHTGAKCRARLNNSHANSRTLPAKVRSTSRDGKGDRAASDGT